MKTKSFFVAGGDLRFIYLANLLAEKGFEVGAFALSETGELSPDIKICENISDAQNYDIVLLPLPADYDKTRSDEIIESMAKSSVLIGGKLSESLKNAAGKAGIEYYDYFEREEFTVRNASLTAEAALSMGLDSRKESIKGMNVLVLGHGRIGRLLSTMLKALDADVTVAARRFSDLAWIRSEGSKPIEFSRLDSKIGDFKLIFNTVPAPVLEKERLMLIKKGATIIDVASKPGGTDFAAAKELGIDAKSALGLPGKFAPKTAGEIIFETVLNILDEREKDNV